MKKSFVYLAGIAVILSACAKEIESPVKEVNPEKELANGEKLVTIVASLPETKSTAAIDGSTASYSWQLTDALSVIEEDATSAATFTLANAEAATAGAFTGMKSNGKDLVYAVTPASVLTAGMEDSGDILYDITLPSTYSDYVPGTTNAVMVGIPNGETDGKYKFELRHAAALMKITYVNVPVGTAGMYLTTDQNINGTWSGLDTVTPELAIQGTGGKTTYLEFEEPVYEANQSMDFYVPVPTGDYGSFNIALYDELGDDIAGTKKKKNSTTSLKKADLFATPTINLAAATKGEEWSYTFDSIEELVTGGADIGPDGKELHFVSTVKPGSIEKSSYARGAAFGGDSDPVITISYPDHIAAIDLVMSTNAGSDKVSVSVSVGGHAIGTTQKVLDGTANANTKYSFAIVGSGYRKGDIVISITNSSTSSKTSWLKSVTINGKLPAGISYSTTAYEAIVNGSFDAPELVNPNGLSGFTYETSDADIADVNTTTGAITIGSTTGNAVITARFAGNSEYSAGEASYTITVKPEPKRYVKATSITSGQNYILVANWGGKWYVGEPIASAYAYISGTEVTPDGSGAISLDGDNDNEYVIATMSGGYSIKQTSNNKYIYGSGSYNNINTGNSAQAWTLTKQVDDTYKMDMGGYYLQFGQGDNENFGRWTTDQSGAVLPYLFIFDDGKSDADIAWKKNGALVSSTTATYDEVNGDNTDNIPSLDNPHSLSPINYSSTNTSVATINSSGVVTLVGGGVTTIKAIFTGNAEYRASTVTYDLTVSDLTERTITKTATNGTIVTSVGGSPVTSAKAGDVVTLSCTPSTDYLLTDLAVTETVSGDEVTVSENSFTMPAKAVTVTATFTISYSITINYGTTPANGSAVAKVGGSTVARAVEGASVTIDATPNSGYKVKSITSSDVSISTGAFSMPGKDVTVTVTFEEGKSWVQVTTKDITAGTYVIMGCKDGTYYYLPSNVIASKNPAVGASNPTVSAGKITSTVTDDMKWTFSGDNEDGFTVSATHSTTTYYLGSTDKAQGIIIATTNSSYIWKATNYDSGNVYLRGAGSTRWISTYGTSDFRYYSSSNFESLVLFKEQ